MSKGKGGFKEKFYGDIAPVITGIGAAIVILGALFKIQHYPGASLMLIVGLGTEALLFVMFAFAPKDAHVASLDDWAKVYPQLLDEDVEYEDEEGVSYAGSNDGLVSSMGDMMADAGINQETISRLGEGLKNLSENVSKMRDMSDASVAASEFAQNAKHASVSLEDLSKSYATTADAMSGMADAAVDAKEYHAQVQNITKNLGSLNAVYEMELQDANNHLKAMNKFYGNLSNAMQNMEIASKDTDEFRSQLSGLTKNMTQLNTVYGNMLSAMKG